jgi:hypothetical protein
LTTSNDEEVQAIACYDIGEFVRHYPNGRAIARSLGAKEIIMKLVDHSNKELQRHALTAVSKMMVQNWAVSLFEFYARPSLFRSDISLYHLPPLGCQLNK